MLIDAMLCALCVLRVLRIKYPTDKDKPAANTTVCGAVASAVLAQQGGTLCSCAAGG